MSYRVGFGFDVHKLEVDCDLWLGGVKIPHFKGLVAHSDGDVLIHSVCDALLGAAALGDIGTHFPDNSDKFKNIDSKILLRETVNLIEKEGYAIANTDSSIVAQKPKINPYIQEIRTTLAETMNIDIGLVSVKATTSEKLGFEGREEGISVYSVAMIEK